MDEGGEEQKYKKYKTDGMREEGDRERERESGRERESTD